ncbi:Ig-like domain-containing protein [Candidatus Methanoprimaticola sp. MG2]|uniref:Ig-like domain-containing protein n=1 Tax=Candidatus Methanoprimaticola sp. MG2 TaxID=3228838 RepID=UPI0039C6BDB4
MAVLVMALCAIFGATSIWDDSDAANGTASSPLTSLNTTADTAIGETYYVAVGSSVTISCSGNWVCSDVTSGYGISQSGAKYAGTVSKAGTITVEFWIPDGEEYGSVTIIAVNASTPVTSVSISGSSSGEVGETITLTATTSPSGATDRTVTWSITSGSSRASITSQTDTSTGGRCVISLESAGSVTVKATASDGSGKSATKTITITEPVTYVSSISISGTSSVEVGSSVTLRATASPTSADDRGVTWSVQSGSAYVTISGSSSSTGGTCTVTGKAAGTAVIKATAEDGGGASKTYTVTVTNPQYTCYLAYNANGGSGAPSQQSYTGTSTTNHTFTISATEPTRSGYIFLGWSTSSSATSATYQPGDTISVGYSSTRTLYAVWQEAVIDITSSPASTAVIVGQEWLYTVSTDVSGCTISVSGADWLSVSGSSVSGTPTSVGSHTVTVTASKTGYTSDVQTFTLTVVSALEYTNTPSNGVVIYVL